jgi:UDP-glucose 4-epimerase
MRVLVTGASGRIGGRTAEELLAQGHAVVGFDQAGARIEHGSYRHVSGALQDREAVGRAAEGVDAVLHLGALMSWNDADARAVFDANVLGTFNVAAAAAAQRVERFVFASSGEVYPETNPAYLPVDEAHPTEPHSYYGLSKLLGEETVHFFGRKAGLPFVILRFSHTQDATELIDPDAFFAGPRFYLKRRIARARQTNDTQRRSLPSSRSMAIPSSISWPAPPTGRPYRMGICDTRDLVRGILLALQHPDAVGETIGIGPDEATSFDRALALIQACHWAPRGRGETARTWSELRDLEPEGSAIAGVRARVDLRAHARGSCGGTAPGDLPT